MNAINIAVADDHPIFLNGLVSVLHKCPDFKVVIEAIDGQDFLTKLDKYGKMPYLAILDVEMPNMNGIDCCIALKKKYPFIKIIILSMNAELSYVKNLINLGVDSYLLKESAGRNVEKAIRRVIDDERYFDNEVQNLLISEFTHSKKRNDLKFNVSLGKREREVLELLYLHKTKHEISDEMNISVTTVETHKKNMMKKFGVHTVAQLLFKAIEYKIIEEDNEEE
jgi:DNA-binding NarL/FixJ family response regulator